MNFDDLNNMLNDQDGNADELKDMLNNLILISMAAGTDLKTRARMIETFTLIAATITFNFGDEVAKPDDEITEPAMQALNEIRAMCLQTLHDIIDLDPGNMARLLAVVGTPAFMLNKDRITLTPQAKEVVRVWESDGADMPDAFKGFIATLDDLNDLG